MSDQRRRGQGDARRILAVGPGNPGRVPATTPLARVLTTAAEVAVSDGRVEVAR